MTYPIVRFVSEPDVDADVRFDFNTAGEWSDDETWPEHDGFSLGVPSLEGDPDAYGVQYGLRQLEFNVIVSGTYSDASRQWSRLAKEMVSRRTNWLMFQFSPMSRPVWFKTYRTAPDALDFEQVDDTDDAATNLWGLGVQLAAEPFAYGERVTLPPVAIKNNPSATSNPCMAVLPEILGDAPAPARYEMSVDATRSIPSPMFAVTPVDDTFAAPIVYQFGAGDTAVAGTDADQTTASVSYSGGSARAIDFATDPSMVLRLTQPVSNIRPGRYALMLRVARVNADATHAYQVNINGRTTGPVVTLDRPISPATFYAQWLHLGDFTLPAGLADFSATDPVSANVNIFVQRLTGSSNTAGARIDAMVLMPVELFDGEPGMRLTTLPDSLGVDPLKLRWDGDDEYIQSYNGSTPTRMSSPIPAGQFPVLTPGRRNVLHLFGQTSGAARSSGVTDLRPTTDNSDDVTQTTTVTVSYHPRHLWLAP